MHWIDWTIIAVYLVWIVWDGLRLTKNTDELEGYFLASRSLPWWAVGSVGDGDAAVGDHDDRHAPARAMPTAWACCSSTTRCRSR